MNGPAKFLPMLFWGLFITGCSSNISYKLEILKSPIALVALTKTAPFNYTELNFSAYNVETDFSGYKITVGTTQEEAIAGTNPATPYSCLFSTNSNYNKPTKIQLGGSAAVTGYDCYIPETSPLGVATWVAVKSFATRDCTKYSSDSNCSEVSNVASAEVLPFVAPPTNVSIQNVLTPDPHYILDVSMTTVPPDLTGIGLFYSPNQEEAEFKASVDGTIWDGFCPLTPASVTPGVNFQIQIGGTPVSGVVCYIGNFYANTGDTLVLRNAVNRIKYPWSDFLSVTIP